MNDEAGLDIPASDFKDSLLNISDSSMENNVQSNIANTNSKFECKYIGYSLDKKSKSSNEINEAIVCHDTNNIILDNKETQSIETKGSESVIDSATDSVDHTATNSEENHTETVDNTEIPVIPNSDNNINCFKDPEEEVNKALNKSIIGYEMVESLKNGSFFYKNDLDGLNATASSNKDVTNLLSSSNLPGVNPVPNEFDLVKENNLSNCGSNLSNTTDLVVDSDTSVVLSNSNAFPQSEIIVSSNYSLAQLKAYESDDSLNEEEEEPEASQKYRETNDVIISEKEDSESDSSSTSSSTSILISDSSDSETEDEYENYDPEVHKPIKANKELDLKDLPPIEDLKISVPEEKCEPVGRVFQIVNELVIVQALKDVPAYNLDTVLFIEGGQPFGKIFDVFGPVTEPYYCVRFNSNEQIREKNITLNQMVYCAPQTKYTKFVFLAQLMKLKGSDASWEDDDEPPEIYLEYSDDEQERRARKKFSRNKKKALMKSTSDPDEPARKKHFAYEKKMNERNLQLSAINNNKPNRNRFSGPQNGPSTSRTPSQPFMAGFPPFNDASFGRMPVFNNKVPPPGMQHSPRPGMSNNPNAGSGSSLSINTTLPGFFNPGSSSHFPQMFPQHIRGSLNNNSVNQSVFPPPQFQAPRRNDWTPTIPNRDTPWVTSPTPPPNNSVPSSPYWMQRHPPPAAGSPCPRPYWPGHSPQQPPHFNSPPVNFNPNVPPPIPNPFNFKF